MHQRDVLAAGGGTLSDTLHQALAAVTVFLMFLGIGFGATASGKRFRLYSIVTIVVLLVFGGLTFLEAPRLQMNLPTPWIGLWERISISVFLLWTATLAAVLWRTPHERRDSRLGRERTGGSHAAHTLRAVHLLVLYWFPIRRWMNQWGAAPSDVARVMAGDSLLTDHTYSGTTAVIVHARPEHIWPWLVQIGYQRGGLYSYDWLDRLFGYLDRPSATRILPEFQHLAVGDHIPVGRGPCWPVAVVEANRALVLDMRNMVGGLDWVWQFGLYPIDETRTTLISRSRVRAQAARARLLTHAIEPAGFVMTRRMLLGLKQRAEALRAANAGETRASQRPAA
jgi:hypothetical protein